MGKSMETCLDELFLKKGSKRENALMLLEEGFRNEIHHPFLKDNCITLLDRCLNCIKRGSSKEIHLATQTIGLLSIIIGNGANVSHEILEESITPLSEVLKSGSEKLKTSSLLDCMAIVTIVGSQNSMETERSMQVIWEFIQSKSSPNVPSKTTLRVLKSAISAWTFLLASMNKWNISGKIWKGALSHLSYLLNNDNEQLIQMAASEALILIFELGTLEKFSKETKDSINGLKGTNLNKVKNLSMEMGGKISNKKVPGFLEDGDWVETSIKIGQDVLDISTWSQLIQVNFLKNFLGVGFDKHMQENELFHNFFGFEQKRKQLSCDEQQLQDLLGDEKEAIHYVYLPELVRSKPILQRMFKSPNSFLNKERTKMINKQRMLSQASNLGYYGVNSAEEDG